MNDRVGLVGRISKQEIQRRRDAAETAPPFIADDLKKIFEKENVCKGWQKLPTVAGFSKLAEELELLRSIHLHSTGIGAEYQRNIQINHQKILSCLDTLQELLPDYYNEHKRNVIMFKSVKIHGNLDEVQIGNVSEEIEISQKKFRIVSDLISCIKKTKDYGVIFRLPEINLPSLYSLGDSLKVSFISAMQTTNPDFKVGRSNTGPFPRFIKAVAPLITGDILPSVEAAAKQILVRRKTVNR